MTDQEGADTSGLYPFATLFLAVASAGLAAVVLILGWGMGNSLMVNEIDGLPSMVPTTAVCFCLLAAAIVLGWWCDNGWRARTAYALSFMVVAIVLVNLVTGILPDTRGLDRLILGARVGDDYMAVATGIGLLMGCYCVLALMAPDNPDPEGPTYFAMAGLSTSVGVIVGHTVDPMVLHELAMFHGMSIETGLAFALLFGAVLSYPHDRTGIVSFRE